MEENFAIKPIGVRYICDKCGVGELLPTGKTNWVNNPPRFEHECNKCRSKMVLSEKYPMIRYQKLT